MKMRLIDAEALLDAISVHLERIEQEIEDAPNIDHVRRGRWGSVGRDIPWLKKCSECKTLVDNAGTDWNYCPNCGARMDGEVCD